MAAKVRKCSKLDDEGLQRRQELYAKYIEPYYRMIYKLCKQYSYHNSTVEENYNEVLMNFYLRIETYDPAKSILTWIHICTKRHVQELEKRRNKHNYDDNIDETMCGACDEHQKKYSDMDITNWREMYSDELLTILDRMNPLFRNALLLQEAGYSLKEIAKHEFDNGNLKKNNIETIKSRIFHARQYIKKYLDKNGNYRTTD